jgi:hypothetical protein
MTSNTLSCNDNCLYSCNSQGELQGRWRLSSGQTEALLAPDKNVDLHDAEQYAIDCIRALKSQPDDANKKLALEALCLFLPYQDVVSALVEKDWQLGVQLVVVDYPLPADQLMLASFAIHQTQALSNSELQKAVIHYVNSGGSCCGL